MREASYFIRHLQKLNTIIALAAVDNTISRTGSYHFGTCNLLLGRPALPSSGYYSRVANDVNPDFHSNYSTATKEGFVQ